MASIDRVMALAEELKKKKKDKNYEVSQSTINTLDLAKDIQSGNKDALTTYLSNNKDFDAPIGNLNKKDERSWFNKGAFEDGYDFGDISKSIMGTINDVRQDVYKGGARIIEGVVDTGAYAVGGIAKLTGNDKLAQSTKDFIKRDWVEETKIANILTNLSPDNLNVTLGETAANYIKTGDKGVLLGAAKKILGEDFEEDSVLGDKSDSVVQSGGQLAGTIGLQAIGVPWWLTTGVTSFGGETQQAFQQDATYGEAGFSGLVTAGAEILTEKLSGGISFGGKTLDDTLIKPLTDKIANKTIKTLVNFGIDVVGEGTEEVISEVLSNVGKKLSYEDEKTWGEMLTSEEAMDSYLEAFIGGAVLGGGFSAGKTINSIKTGRDYKTGLTANEQAIVDIVIEDRIEESEKGGNKLSEKEKEQIKTEVQEDLEKGYISTDTIESALGGTTYSQLSEIRNNQTNIENQIRELENKANAEITVAEMERLQALREQYKAIDTKTLETQLQAEMGQKIKSDTYLQRSYQEKAARSKEFTYETTDNDSEYRRGVYESTKGKMNNTTRAHETAEALVKLSEDRKMQYKFTNNAELKDMGLTQEGKTANGIYVVEKDGKREILVNTDSKKYVEAVLVHETTHDFKNTSPETYTKLVDVTKQFAEAQQDYARVYSEVAGMYKGVEKADITDEVTARLLEDYLGNKDFVNSLSTKEPNIVKKIIDEVKYLYKKFTAGSPEARKLLKLQHDLEKAYREAYRQTKVAETTENTMYSTSEVDSLGRKLTEAQIEFFKDSKVRDEDGNLLVMYHGTGNEFTTFDINKSGQQYEDGWSAYGRGFYFTPDKANAETFSKEAEGNNKHVKEVYLNITNPFYANEDATELFEKYGLEPFINSTGRDFITQINVRDGRDASTKILQELGYDGVIETFGQKGIDEAVAYNPNQIKSVDNKNPTESADIRYSLSEDGKLVDNKGNEITLETSDTGTHGTLMAIHNLNESKLKGIIELGGFPVPSIAVTNPNLVNHNEFGDMSVLFDKSTIDPKNKKNEIYDRDIWSPTFPRVEYEADANRLKEIKKLLNINSENYNNLDSIQRKAELDLRQDYIEGKLDSYDLDGLKDTIKGNRDIQYAYLKAKGLIEPEYKAIQYNRDVSNEVLQTFLEQYQGSTEFSWHTPLNELDYDQTMQLSDTIKRIVKPYLEKQYGKYGIDGQELIEKELNSYNNFSALDKFIYSAKSMERNGIDRQEIDEHATLTKASEILNKEEYDKWVDETFDDVISQKGIRNGKEMFTPSGNRRSFKATHDEINLDNLVKILSKGNTKGGQEQTIFGTGFGRISAQTSQRFNSIKDIKANENRLMAREEAGAIIEPLSEKLFVEVDELAKFYTKKDYGSDMVNHMQGVDVTSELIEEFASGTLSEERLRKLLREYMVYDVDKIPSKLLNDIIEDLNNVKQLPTDYFEAKPQRAVGLDEVQAIVIPNDVDAEFKQQLQDAGLKYYEYDRSIEGDRQRVINQFDDLKFSMSNESDIAPTSTPNQTAAQDIKLQVEEAIAPLQEEITQLREQLNLTSETTQPDERIDEYAPALQEVVEEQNTEAFNTIEDTDMPSEIEDTIPETEEYSTIESPLEAEGRDIDSVGSRKVKAYQYEHPEVRPYFQLEAEVMLNDLKNSVKGEKVWTTEFNPETGFFDNAYVTGTKRQTTDDIAYLLDNYNYTYADIEKGLNAIIEDDGKENIAVAKRIEFMLDERLRNGYTSIDGTYIPANQEYINLLHGKEITNQYGSLPIGEAPVEDASNTEVAEEIAPVRREVDWDSVEDTSKGNQITYNEETQTLEEDLVKKTKKELRKALLGTEAQKEFITNALDNAKNRSMAFMNNTDTIRNTELVFGRDAGKIINEVIFQKEIDNEADSIKWQNKERDEIKALGIKARSKESAAVQKYGEKQYVDDAGNVMTYGDAELVSEFSDVATQEKIKRAAQVIRSKYDAYIDEANKVLTKLGFDPIKKRNDYMRHFQELNDVFSRWGLPFNAQNMQEHVLPTDINGLTEFWSPQKNYFANMQPRKGVKTTYDAITGVDGYIGGIANLIYHTEDIQRGRAFEELIRETYGEDKGWDNLENLPDDVKQLRAEKIQDNHLSNYAAWVHEWTNNVAGKKNKLDRSVEAVFGRKAFSFLDQIRKQVGANMIGFNLSSSLTNLIAPVQAMAKTNKLAVAKGTADTIKNIFIKDNFMDNNRFLTSRMGTDMISKNAWQKIQDAGYVFMKGMDWFSSNQIVRSKYYELRAKGMSEAQAHAEAGQFAARILGDRTKGANAQIYNSKLLGLVTQFQLEVNNQLYSTFYDTYHESKANAQGNAARMAAGMTFTLGQLFAFTHLFGKTFESIAGYNPTFDVIGILMTALGWGDDDDEKTTSERLKAAADQLVDALPYVNILTGGGRVPVASGIPNLVGVATGGKDQYGNELTLEDEMKKLLYLIPPTGGNQVKKTTQGLRMFDEDLPVSGSYTDSGNLRFPVEDTPLNRVQAGLFGQWANKNAREYFDKERQPLKEKQIQEYADLDLPIKDYWEYRDGLKDQKTIKDKFEYVNSLDVTTEQKNIMINNIVDREEKVDMSNYDDFGSYEEFDFAIKNEEKYNFLQSNNISYSEYNRSEESREAYNWAYNNPESYIVSKAIADVVTYRKYANDLNDLKADKDENGKSISGSRKEKVIDYINSLDADYGSKLILYKMEYPSDDDSNYEIINYLNEREDITYEDMVTILTKLDMRVDANGNIFWD